MSALLGGCNHGCASSSVYSTLATPPSGSSRGCLSSVSWSMRRIGHDEVLLHFLAVEDCSATQRRASKHGSDGDGHGLVAVRILLLLPPLQLVFAVAMTITRGRRRLAASKLGCTVAVTALGHDGGDLRQARQDAGDGTLCDVGPVAMDGATILNCGYCSTPAWMPPRFRRHEDAGEAADFEQVTAIGELLGQIFDLAASPFP